MNLKTSVLSLLIVVVSAFTMTLRAGIVAFNVPEMNPFTDLMGYTLTMRISNELEDVDVNILKTYKDFESAVEDLRSGKIDIFVGLPPRFNGLIYTRRPVYAMRYASPWKCKGQRPIEWDPGKILKYINEGKCVAFSALMAKWLVENGAINDYVSFGKVYFHAAFSRNVPKRVIERIEKIIEKMYKENTFYAIVKSLGLEGFIIPPDLLTFANSDFPPYEYTENGEWKGTDVEILKSVFSKLGYEVRIEKIPWIRTLWMIKNKRVDGTFTIEKTPEREEYMIFVDEPISIGMDVIFYREGEKPDFSDPKSIRMGVVRGYAEEDYVRSKGYDMILVNSDETGFRMLEAKRIDAFITDYAVGVYYLRKLDLKGITHTEPVRIYKLYIALSKHKAHEFLAEDLKTVLKEFKISDEYRKIMEKYGMRRGGI